MGLLIREERFTADDVTVALRASADNDDLSAEAVEVDDLSDFSELVELPAILQFVKAVELRNAYENILTDSRIVTDIRPVFPDGKVDRVEAAMINHTILLTYQNGEESEAQRLYVAVDLDDLEKLKAQIDRALDKEHATRALIEAAAVTRLEPTEGPENGQIERAGGDTDGS